MKSVSKMNHFFDILQVLEMAVIVFWPDRLRGVLKRGGGVQMLTENEPSPAPGVPPGFWPKNAKLNTKKWYLGWAFALRNSKILPKFGCFRSANEIFKALLFCC